jgi:glyoxylase-like metal-dependent hydrolase (beta-lactamase superfamily II)
MTQPQVHFFYDDATATLTYVAWDPSTLQAAVIDPVLDYDPEGGLLRDHSIQKVLSFLQEKGLTLQWILETHIHADHITGAALLKEKTGAPIAIGAHIQEVLDFWIPFFQTQDDTHGDGSQYDRLFQEGDTFHIGTIPVRVLHTPGHTPACITYVMPGMAFVGDALFMPDVGAGRADFPGGDAATLYQSLCKIYDLPEDTLLYTGHDYPPQGKRSVQPSATVAEEKAHNILMQQDTPQEAFVAKRQERDHGKPVPRLLYPSIQMNMRCGALPLGDGQGRRFMKIPLKFVS